jgi:hypothetical protein
MRAMSDDGRRTMTGSMGLMISMTGTIKIILPAGPEASD